MDEDNQSIFTKNVGLKIKQVMQKMKLKNGKKIRKMKKIRNEKEKK